MLGLITYIPTILAYAFISLLVAILSFIVVYVSHKIYITVYENLPVPGSQSAIAVNSYPPVPPPTAGAEHSFLGQEPGFGNSRKQRKALKIIVRFQTCYLAYVIFEAGRTEMPRRDPTVDNKLLKHYDRLSAIPRGRVMQVCQPGSSPTQSENGEPEPAFVYEFPDTQPPNANAPSSTPRSNYNAPPNVPPNAIMDRQQTNNGPQLDTEALKQFMEFMNRQQRQDDNAFMEFMNRQQQRQGSNSGPYRVQADSGLVDSRRRPNNALTYPQPPPQPDTTLTAPQPTEPTFSQPTQPAFSQPKEPTFVQPTEPTFVQPTEPMFVQPDEPTRPQQAARFPNEPTRRQQQQPTRLQTEPTLPQQSTRLQTEPTLPPQAARLPNEPTRPPKATRSAKEPMRPLQTTRLSNEATPLPSETTRLPPRMTPSPNETTPLPPRMSPLPNEHADPEARRNDNADLDPDDDDDEENKTPSPQSPLQRPRKS